MRKRLLVVLTVVGMLLVHSGAVYAADSDSPFSICPIIMPNTNISSTRQSRAGFKGTRTEPSPGRCHNPPPGQHCDWTSVPQWGDPR